MINTFVSSSENNDDNDDYFGWRSFFIMWASDKKSFGSIVPE